MKALKNITLFAAALAFGLTLAVGNAEAARIGGGKSFGMQRQMAPVSKPATAAPQTAAPAARAPGATTPAAQPSRSWMGPIAGLAAGLGLAALASHFGFGEELANVMMIALLAFAAMAIIGFIMRKRAGQPATMAGAGAPYNAPINADQSRYQATQTTGSAVGGSNVPAGFDTEGFIRNAKVGFIRLQAAHDAGDLADIREFTSPEMFAEIRMDLEQRNGLPQKTDIVSLNADILDIAQDANRYIVSTRFSGMLREEANAAPVAIDEIWHLTKPINGQGGWVLAGIQQVQ